MTEKTLHRRRFAGFFSGRGFFLAAFLATFLLGYNLTLSGLQQSGAAPTTGLPVGSYTPAPPATAVWPPIMLPGVCLPTDTFGDSEMPCEGVGTAELVTGTLISVVYGFLSGASNQMENYIYQYIQATLQSEYVQLDWLEKSMISWWQTMWNYYLLPSLQQMTRQLNVELALQSMHLHTFADATAMQETWRSYARHEIEDQERMPPPEQVCVAATEMGSFQRATTFSRLMRQAWEVKSLAAGLNTKTDPNGNPYPGATSVAGSMYQQYADWQNIFCDENGNSGKAPCGNNVDANLTNMDVLPVKYLFNNLTINVNDKKEGKNLELGLEYLINNLVGLPSMEAVPASAISASGGHDGYLLRRSYLARYAAIRSVPDMVAGWRMPGSSMGKWITDLRETSGGVPASLFRDTDSGSGPLTNGIAKNPSYKEVMHALSIDRFNSGMYGGAMITDPAKLDLEKLDISVFYLMQLRDYYELLERTALTLAVQVSLLADEQDPGSPNAAAPFAPAPPGG